MPADASLPILVVDDFPTMVRILRRLLSQAGYKNVSEAANGEAALDLMSKQDFGLVISDWNMEPMNGFELLNKVRSDERLKQTPFLMVTADADSEKMIEARRASVSGFLVKPFNAETLKGRIESALAA